MNDVTDTIRTQGGAVFIRGASVTVGDIDTTGANGSTGGDITVRADNGSIAVGTLTSSGGAATAGNNGNNAGTISLITGDTAGINDTITLTGNLIANGSDADGGNIGGNAGSIILRAGNATGGEDRITLNGDITISAQGGNSTDINNAGLHSTIDIDTPLLETTGVVTLTTERSRNYNASAQGGITLGDGGNIAQVILGGDLIATAGYKSDTNLITTIDYNGITTGTLTFNAGNDVNVVGVINDSDTANADVLNVLLKANTDGDNNGDVIINGIQNTPVTINTGGGTYTITGVNYDGESTASSKITVDTGMGNADINVTGYVRLGEMIIDGNLDVAAGATDAGNSIRQGTFNVSDDRLTVAGAASFVSDALTGNIDLTNNNDLQGAISITTTGSNADALLNNNDTTLGLINTDGRLTINTNQNLVLGNDITVGGTAQLNFGQDNNGRTFTAQTGVAYSANTSTITGGTGNDTFELSASLSGTINGANGNDIFNINAAGLTFSDISGGNNTDTVRGPNAVNTWRVNSNGGGTLNSTIAFSQMETLTGGTGTGVDTFTVNTGSTIGTLNGRAGDDQFTVNGIVTTLIDGGAGANTLTGRNTDTTWSITTAGTANSLTDTSGTRSTSLISPTSTPSLVAVPWTPSVSPPHLLAISTVVTITISLTSQPVPQAPLTAMQVMTPLTSGQMD